MIPLTIPVFNKEMEEAAIQALNNEMFVGGESVHKFEEEFAAYIGTDYAVSVNSGSSALLLTFSALGIKTGERIIAPSATFIATVNGPCLLGGRPHFCEIGSDYVISPNAVQKILHEVKCKYIVPVHLYGHPCDMSALIDSCLEKDIMIIEDAAQAHGAEYKGRRTGSFGAAGIFSFYPTKNMTVAGDGGMVTTNESRIYDSIRKMRDVGRMTKYTHDKIGYTLRLNSVNAAIGRVQLRYLHEWNKKRRSIAKMYDKGLEGVGDIILPPKSDGYVEPVYHMYVIRTKHRNSLGAWLFENGVSTGIHYPIPVHRQPAYNEYTREHNLPFTDEWSTSVLSLPIHPNLKQEDNTLIIELINKFYNEKVYETKEAKEAEKEWIVKLT